MRVESDQQMFDAAWLGLRAQGFVKCTFGSPQWIEGESCQWEDDRGRRCAIGHANAKYRGDAHNYPSFDEFLSFEAMLRACHNSATSPQDMETRLRQFAAAKNLSIPDDGAKGNEIAFANFKAKILAPLDTAIA